VEQTSVDQFHPIAHAVSIIHGLFQAARRYSCGRQLMLSGGLKDDRGCVKTAYRIIPITSVNLKYCLRTLEASAFSHGLVPFLRQSSGTLPNACCAVVLSQNTISKTPFHILTLDIVFERHSASGHKATGGQTAAEAVLPSAGDS
jgi:hypothetical protein